MQKIVHRTETTVTYEKCGEEELRAIEYAYKLLTFNKKRKKEFPQKARKRFLKLLIDFCRRANEFLENDSPQYIAILAILLRDCPKKPPQKGYMTEQELSREIQRIIREEREMAGE